MKLSVAGENVFSVDGINWIPRREAGTGEYRYMRTPDGQVVDLVAPTRLPVPYPHRPWKPGMSRRFTHCWAPQKCSSVYFYKVQTCIHCGLRRLFSDDSLRGGWHYRQLGSPNWRRGTGAANRPPPCALRPDAPAEPRNYERDRPKRSPGRPRRTST